MAATMERQPQPLTPEEQARPYAKFYTMEFPGPDPATVALMAPDRPIPQDQMLLPEDMSRLLDPGNFETEIGWGMMDNGAGYIAMRHEMPGVTVEMVDWWFAWHPIEGLRYRIWYPPYHLGVHVDDWAQPRLLDPGVPVRDKCEKVVHHVTEDTGMGTEHIDIHFLTPEQMGFDMSRWHKPNVGTFVGGFGWSLNEHQPPEIPAAPAIMVHFIREIDGGVEWRTRFWMGYTILNGHPVPLLPPGIRVPEPAVFGLANHNIYEYTRLKSLLPLSPVGYSIYKSEERMTEALGMVLDVKERLPQVTATRPALPGGRPRRAQHGAERRAVLPHGAHAQGVARLVHPRGLPGARRRRVAQVGLRGAGRRRRCASGPRTSPSPATSSSRPTPRGAEPDGRHDGTPAAAARLPRSRPGPTPSSTRWSSPARTRRRWR